MATESKITVVEVAKAAGVAVGTVSRVLNNHADVNAALRERVLRAARSLNYTRLRAPRAARPHANGHGAAGGLRAGNIGAVFFGMEDALVHLPIVSAALHGVETALSSQGRSLLLANVPDGARVPPFLQEDGVLGLILKGPNQGLLPSDEESPLLRAIYRLPHVWVMGRLPNARGDHVNFDTVIAGRLAAEHLHEKGHRRVAFFNPKPGQTQFERVKSAFLDAAARLGHEAALLEVPARAELAWPLPAITAQENVNVLLDQWAKAPKRTRPTALFVPSDRTAVQLYTALERRGLRVGADVSVVSCNNERSLVGSLHPGLTSIDVHADVIGRRAVDQLLWRIAHPDEPQAMQLLVEPTLVARDSVAEL